MTGTDRQCGFITLAAHGASRCAEIITVDEHRCARRRPAHAYQNE
jgi:hypothetical protein